MVLLAACVAAIAVTGVRFPGYGLPGWLDATFDPRFEAQQGRFPALLDWLPHLGELKAVTVMTLACALTLDALGSLLRPEPAAPPPPAALSAAERPAGSQVRPRPPTRS
jgi:hypothetical protein